MKMVWMLFMLAVTVKAAIAVTEHPRPVFDALHESGETREVAEWARMEVAFFASALVRVRAIVWMATRILEVERELPGDIHCWNRAMAGAFRKGRTPQELAPCKGKGEHHEFAR